MTLRPGPSPRRPKSGWRQALGGRSHREGHGAEWTAALWLMLKGYQILAFRLKGRGGEIDILAKRGRTLARGRPSLQGLDLRIDMVALAPKRFPRHLRGVTTTGTDIS